METGKTYPIGTIDQMAKIPADAMPRFLSELQHVLAEIGRVHRAVEIANEIAGDAVLSEPDCSGVTWTDDDLRQFTQSVAIGEDVIFQRSGSVDELGEGNNGR